ncbi:MAG: phosphotransferase [Gemmatimonadetes bacterium]|nr:fructosamine kinase family protein [Gemmatimonadota bacterium]NNM05002.1 phosphotransferase [Gemmatimonadota bacterium]
MTLPGPVASSVEKALEKYLGTSGSILSASPVGGGCINPSAKVVTESGSTFFLKWNPSSPPEMFGAEVDGLKTLKKPEALRVPEVIGTGGSGAHEDPGWLLMEFIPQGRPGPDYGSRLGRGLAALHSAVDMGSEPGFGWTRDNFIGSLNQSNDPCDDWPTFWRDSRLEPQLRMARDRGHFGGKGGKVLENLLSRLEEVMATAGEGGPALLHGDLWSGNFYPDSSGEPVLIDPAVYRGTGEVDLAMMELFGSFPMGFQEAYDEGRGIPPEYDAFRRDLYQLYYLLVHVNLFGGGYVGGSLSAARRVLKQF